MLKFLQSIFSAGERAGGNGVDEHLIERATERLVDATDPRLRAIGGYKKKLRPGVERAVEHAITLGDTFAPPIELSRTAFGRDPSVRALFASPDHMEETLSASIDIRRWLGQANVPPDMLCALLVANWDERNVFGMEVDGDRVQRDVAQVVVNFSEHRYPAVTGSESDTRREAKTRAFDLLVKTALARLVGHRHKKQNLERERSLLAKKLKELDGANFGLTLQSGHAAPDSDPAQVETRVAQIEQELAGLGSSTATLDDHMALIVDTLQAAPEHLRLDKISFVLDQRNVKRSTPNGDTAHAIEYPLLHADERRAVVMLVQFPRASIRAPQGFLS